MFTTRLLQKLHKIEVRFVITTLIITVAVAVISAHFKLTWRSGFALAFGMYGILALFAFRRKDTFKKTFIVWNYCRHY